MELNDGLGSVAIRIVDVRQLHVIVDRVVDLKSCQSYFGQRVKVGKHTRTKAKH